MYSSFYNMNEFNYLNYCTEYSVSGSFKKPMQEEACFRSIFNKATNDGDYTYTIRLYTSYKKLGEKNNNYCFFNKSQVKNHINQLKDLGDFKSVVIDKKDHIEVIIKISQQCNLFHRYLVSWIRYLYEFPYNVLLLDAYRLKQEKKFRFTSISNLMNICVSAYPVHYRDLHGITQYKALHKPLSKKNLKKRIEDTGRLHSIYKTIDEDAKRLPNDMNYYNLDFWESLELYNEIRKPIYLELEKLSRL